MWLAQNVCLFWEYYLGSITSYLFSSRCLEQGSLHQAGSYLSPQTSSCSTISYFSPRYRLESQSTNWHQISLVASSVTIASILQNFQTYLSPSRSCQSSMKQFMRWYQDSKQTLKAPIGGLNILIWVYDSIEWSSPGLGILSTIGLSIRSMRRWEFSHCRLIPLAWCHQKDQVHFHEHLRHCVSFLFVAGFERNSMLWAGLIRCFW